MFRSRPVGPTPIIVCGEWAAVSLLEVPSLGGWSIDHDAWWEGCAVARARPPPWVGQTAGAPTQWRPSWLDQVGTRVDARTTLVEASRSRGEAFEAVEARTGLRSKPVGPLPLFSVEEGGPTRIPGFHALDGGQLDHGRRVVALQWHAQVPPPLVVAEPSGFGRREDGPCARIRSGHLPDALTCV